MEALLRTIATNAKRGKPVFDSISIPEATGDVEITPELIAKFPAFFNFVATAVQVSAAYEELQRREASLLDPDFIAQVQALRDLLSDEKDAFV
jgi:hypothetical protein